MKKINWEKIGKITKRISVIFLIITLILGIASTAFGIGVIALQNDPQAQAVQPAVNSQAPAQTPPQETAFVSPLAEYKDINNQAALNDKVKVISEADSAAINASILFVERQQSYYGNEYLLITLNGEQHAGLAGVFAGDTIYLHGSANTPLGDDRILYVDAISRYGGQTQLRATEPYFEDVFNSLEIFSSNPLSEENFVKAYYANGVTSHFGDVDTEMEGVSQSADLGQEVPAPLGGATASSSQITNTASQYTAEGGDLIVTLNYDFAKNEKDWGNGVNSSSSFSITGEFGIKDLAAHVVCDMPTVSTFEELYFGLSGETFVDIKVNGDVKAESQMEASKKETWLFSFEGLNEKRFPIAVFQFKGTTPVYITNKAFENKKESLIPSLYLILYADWEGEISLGFQAGFEYSHSFNSGLRVYKQGEPCLSFENYPYVQAGNVEDEGNLSWNASLTLDAQADITLFGASALFYVAGVNIGEFSMARIGLETQIQGSLTADSQNGISAFNSSDDSAYIRGYLKIIETKVKLKADGKSFLKNLSIDVEFEFALLDITLFQKGEKPEQYQPDTPISSLTPPTKFESVTILVCDVSGSMYSTVDSGQTKLQASKDACKTIISTTENWSKMYDGNYGIGVVQFASEGKLIGIPHIDYDYLRTCVDIMDDGGGTSAYTGLDIAIAQLDAVSSANKVIILMSDGQDSNDSAALASANVAASKNIKIQTIGFGSDVDEELLKNIASATGGEYQYASTDNTISLIGSFMYAQQSTNATVVTELEGSVSEGETSPAAKFEVDGLNGDLIVTNTWPGSFLDTILIDPNGRVVDEDYPDSTTDESTIPSTIVVKNPIKGTWSVAVKGVETSYEKEPFYTIVAFKEAETPTVNQPMEEKEVQAAYCIPIGIFDTFASSMLLCTVTKRKKKQRRDNGA